jgi:CRISPR-associated endonuclease/helicase Cas3
MNFMGLQEDREDIQPNLSCLWAKDTGYSLLAHSLDVARVTERVCASLPFPPAKREEISRIAKHLGALHDVGKAAAGFQDVLRGKQRFWHRHEILSAAIASQIAPDIGSEGLLAIITHHKSILPGVVRDRGEKCLPDNELPFSEPNFFHQMVSELQNNQALLEELLNTLSQSLQVNWRTKLLNFDSIDLRPLERGWLERSAGIGQREFIPKENRRLASVLRGVLITSDHMASAGQPPVPPAPLTDFSKQVNSYELRDKLPLPYQTKCGETTGDVILKAPTGSGKTAAILLWATHNQAENGRLFYVLPHTASINAMHQRLRNIYSSGQIDRVGVLHHKNASYLFRLFEQESCTKDAAQMARTVSSLARELYHPIRVTTPHQILRVALHGKGWELGLLEFPNACFVFDEIHIFEPLLMGLTIATAKWLKSLGARVLFASATIPKFMENILLEQLEIPSSNIISPDPELPGDKEVCNKIRHRIEVRSGSLIEGLPTIMDEIADSNETALIVCNHVATSQQTYDIVEQRFRNETMLLHSRFNSHDRARIESAITGKNPPRILVATQAVEVSLDLNYGRGYTEPAPADALGQRLGRINRSGSRQHPAHVVVFNEPSKGYLYDEQMTRKTVALLRDVGNLTEQELTEIVNEVYGDGYQDESLKDYQRGLCNSTINRFDEEIIAGTHRAWVEDVIENSDGQIEVLPVEGIDENGVTYSILEEFEHHHKIKNYLQAKELLVPIRIGQWWKLKNERSINYNEILKEWCTSIAYSTRKGLDLSRHIETIF